MMIDTLYSHTWDRFMADWIESYLPEIAYLVLRVKD